MTDRASLGWFLLAWRQAVRDTPIDRTAKLVAYTIETYAGDDGQAYPSKALIAQGSCLGAGKRAVDQAVDRIEEARLFNITRSRGRRPFVYEFTIPTSQDDAALNLARWCDVQEANVADLDREHRTNGFATPHARATEVSEVSEGRNGEGRAALSHVAVDEELLAAVVDACELGPVTESARRKLRRAVAEIRAVGGTPETVAAAARTYRATYPRLALTPNALAAHWPVIVPRDTASLAVCPECETGGGHHVADCSMALEGAA